MVGKYPTSHGQLTKAVTSDYYPGLSDTRGTEAIYGMTACTHMSLGTQSKTYVRVCACLYVRRIPLEDLGETSKNNPEKENSWLRKS